MITNHEIAQLLRDVAAAYTVKDEKKHRFQIMAYERAADSVEQAGSEIRAGIGASIAGHLDELFRTGKVKHFDQVLGSLPEAMFPLLKIPGFGPKKAFKLAKALKLTKAESAVEDLARKARIGKIAGLEGFGEKSQADVLEAIKAFKKGQIREKRMNLPLASNLAREVISYLCQSALAIRVDPLGSLRRQVSTIGDVDLAAAARKPEQIIDRFIKYPKKQKLIESGPTGASLLLTNGRQIDLRAQRPEAYGAMLQYFTGSKNHNIRLRELALKKGFSLSEHGIKDNKTNKLYKFNKEEKIYHFLGLEWIPPELREDTGEIEAALRQAQGKPGGLPKLVEIKNIKGDLHVHSDYPIEPSHDLGIDSMKEMLKKAESLGYEYLGFSEHSPSMANHTTDQVYRILTERKKKIEQLKLTSKIVRVINLLEVDILASGELSISDKSLSLLDGAIVSIHSAFGQSKEEMTKRILHALNKSQVRILGHPTGRLLGKREGYEADWEAIFIYCKKHNKAIEINAWPERLDLPDTLVRQAVKAGVKLIISTDSHALEQMELMSFGVSVARRGWAEKSDILNTLDYNEFWKWLKKL